ncbi:hypothetical protein [Streptomyces sp. RK9]|uniref:hypothetical protein n=1 Tax=Streptomyces sp. RK9 TaxID=3239284 RepID=UPI00386C274B
MEPINTRAPAAAARAYVQLGWSVTLGHRLRPRQGCTCDNRNCPAPGAHPFVTPSPRLAEGTLEEALQSAPGGSLTASTNCFDAVLVPLRVGMVAMLRLDRISLVPCLVTHQQTAALLVLPATGRYAAVHDSVEVRTGPDGWLALPPSNGAIWDTPPWTDATNTPHTLLNGDTVGRELEVAFKLATGTATTTKELR